MAWTYFYPVGEAPLFSSKKKLYILYFLLVLGILFQGQYLFRQIGKDLPRIWGDAIQHGLWRSAKFSQGGKFANYVQFLNEMIPEEGRVVLPPGEYAKPKVLSTTPFMQFFLAPRQVINCSDPDCLDGLSREMTYILIVEDFPPFEWQESNAVMFNDVWGILPPPGSEDKAGIGWSRFSSLLHILLSSIGPVLWLLSLTVAGALLVELLVPGLNIFLKSALGYGFGLSLFTLGMAVIALLGATVNRNTVLGITGAIIGLAVLIYLRFSLVKKTMIPKMGTQAFKIDGWYLIFLFLAGFSLILSVGKGYHRTDEILLWGAKGYGLASEGSLEAVTRWGTTTLPYPLHIPMLIAAFRILFMEVLPAGKIIYSGYYLALMLLSFQFLMQVSKQRVISGLLTLLFSTVPLVFLHSTIAYANLAVTYYFLAAVWIWVLLLEGYQEKNACQAALLCGFFYAAASWCRPEAFYISWLIILLGIITFYFLRRSFFSRKLGLSLITPILAYSLFWWLLESKIYSTQPVRSGELSSALIEIRGGSLHLANLDYIFRSLFSRVIDFETWGVIGLGVLLILILIIYTTAFRNGGVFALLSGLVFILFIIVVYYLASFRAEHDISWWINTGFDRMLLPGVAFVWFGGWVALQKNVSNT